MTSESRTQLAGTAAASSLALGLITVSLDYVVKKLWYAKQKTLRVQKLQGQSEAAVNDYMQPKTLISAKAKNYVDRVKKYAQLILNA